MRSDEVNGRRKTAHNFIILYLTSIHQGSAQYRPVNLPKDLVNLQALQALANTLGNGCYIVQPYMAAGRDIQEMTDFTANLSLQPGCLPALESDL